MKSEIIAYELQLDGGLLLSPKSENIKMMKMLDAIETTTLVVVGKVFG
jgi:hypothetical protein